ncbi:hypothetical protein RF11_08084 [Thelohanellus kitauei]|uniref:Uncharacterized protein n=1 Tax=Thelohanellus kitauei TaxID=669202 RepID=A0A0C2JCF8_THEKT|nr:hypothetical protein RF11_08083 [Thelohanellus kitauei]KII66873.1 hypothetical protein RF11_08084 [Thelohanellus kitauei]
MFHSLNCNETIEMNHFGRGYRSYLSRVYLIKHETLNILNTTRSTTVAVNFVVSSQHNNSYGKRLYTLTLKGWRLKCPSTILASMMIEDVLYDPSWNVFLVLI